MPEEGLEPTPPCGERILNPPRLPFRHSGVLITLPPPRPADKSLRPRSLLQELPLLVEQSGGHDVERGWVPGGGRRLDDRVVAEPRVEQGVGAFEVGLVEGVAAVEHYVALTEGVRV